MAQQQHQQGYRGLSAQVQSQIAKDAAEAIARLTEAQTQIQNQVAQGNLQLSQDACDRLAEQIVRKSFERDTKPSPTPQLSNFSKFENKTSPTTFLAAFEAELELCKLVDDSDKMKWLPECMGQSVKWFASKLRAQTSWHQMTQLFEQQFKVDTNTILTDLQYMRCQNFDISKFIEDFNAQVSMLQSPMDPGTERLVKQYFADGLPFHVKEHVIRNTNYPIYTLTDVQVEARRQMAISTMLNKTKRFEDKKGDDDRNKKPDKYDKRDNKQQPKTNFGDVDLSDLWGSRPRCNVITLSGLPGAGQQKVVGKVEQLEQFVKEEEDQGLAVLAEGVLRVATQASLSRDESEFIKGVENMLVGSIVRQEAVARETRDVGVGRGRGKLSARDLMTEVERVLSRSNSGMTLLERLQRDPVLREDLVSLLRDFEQLEIVDQMVTVADKARKRARPDSGFDQTDTANVATYRAALPAWDSKQEEKFEKYYGAHPSNCEGARYFGNSEQQDCFANVTGTSFDVTSHQPVRSNIPQINVLLDGKWKCRALVDSGSTTTMLSSGLLRLMGSLKDSMHATSFGFFGVGEEQLKFSGILYNLSVQLTDILKTVVPCAVYENTQPIMILGNDLIGGINSVFSIVSHAALQSCYLLQDGALNLDVLPFIKNVEGVGFPPEPKANMAKASNEQNPVYGLFRRS